MIRYLRRRGMAPGVLALALLFMGSAVLKLVTAHYLGQVAEAGVAGDSALLGRYALGLALALAGSFGYEFFAAYASSRLIEGFFAGLRGEIFARVLRMPYDRLDDFSQGDLMVRLTQNLTRLNDTVSGKWAWLGQVLLTALTALIRCFFLCWPLALVYAALLPGFVTLIAAISRSSQDQHLEEARAAAGAVQQATDAFAGYDVVRAYRLEGIMEHRFARHNRRIEDVAVAIGGKMVRLSVVRYFLGVASLLAVFLVGSLLLRYGRITLGGLVSFLTLSQSIQSAVGLMDSVAYALRIAQADIRRVDELLSEPLEEERWNTPLTL